MAVPPGKREAFPLPLGRWADLPCRLSERDAVCPVKLLKLDLTAETRLYFGGVYPLRAYPEDFASALAARKLFWTGPPDDRSLGAAWMGRPGIDLETWLEQSDRFTRFFGEGLLTAAQRSDWDLLMGYLPVIDEAGHQLLLTDPRQPGFTPERRDALEAARRKVWQAVDRELARLLGALDLRSTVVVIVSDHGMTPVHTAVDPNVLLQEKGLLAADRKGKVQEKGTLAWTVGSGGVVHVYVAPDRPDLVPVLRDLFAGWTVNGEHPVERIYSRKEAAAVHLDHPDSGDLILFLREGFGDGEANTYGKHGYLTTYPDMRGIYMALGAGIPPGNAGTVRNPEVAGRVASWLGIGKPRPEP
jgi:predicted AlkP superfamily pyrophosphatase or phosphodiesterase